MLKISKLTDYAMLVMSQMAKDPGATLSATVIAEALYLTPPTVSKVLKMLSDADLLSSVRGAEGGYHLARPASEMTVADIIAAMEGDLALTECCESAGLCAIDSMCTMRHNWLQINDMVKNLLKGFTVSDMLTPLKSQAVGVTLHGK